MINFELIVSIVIKVKCGMTAEVGSPWANEAVRINCSVYNGCYWLKMGPAVDHGLRTFDYEYDYKYSNLIPAPRCPPVRYPTHKCRLHHQVLPCSSTYFAQRKLVPHFGSINDGNVKFYKN